MRSAAPRRPPCQSFKQQDLFGSAAVHVCAGSCLARAAKRLLVCRLHLLAHARAVPPARFAGLSRPASAPQAPSMAPRPAPAAANGADADAPAAANGAGANGAGAEAANGAPACWLREAQRVFVLHVHARQPLLDQECCICGATLCMSEDAQYRRRPACRQAMRRPGRCRVKRRHAPRTVVRPAAVPAAGVRAPQPPADPLALLARHFTEMRVLGREVRAPAAPARSRTVHAPWGACIPVA